VVDVYNDKAQWLSARVLLKVLDNSISGSLAYVNEKKQPVNLALAGEITYEKQLASLNAVTGIKITLNWSAPGKKGQMFLLSSQENLLYGSVYEGPSKAKLLGGINIHL
jgi:hypothetical protein